MHSLLLVDDEVSLLRAMHEYFAMRGFSVDCATEMEEAQALLDCREYSVLVCDVALKSFVDAAGLEVIAQLRGCSQQTKIIILTGGSRTDLQERTRDLGIDEILLKPQPLSHIAEVIDGLLSVDPVAKRAIDSHADAS